MFAFKSLTMLVFTLTFLTFALAAPLHVREDSDCYPCNLNRDVQTVDDDNTFEHGHPWARDIEAVDNKNTFEHGHPWARDVEAVDEDEHGHPWARDVEDIDIDGHGHPWARDVEAVDEGEHGHPWARSDENINECNEDDHRCIWARESAKSSSLDLPSRESAISYLLASPPEKRQERKGGFQLPDEKQGSHITAGKSSSYIDGKRQSTIYGAPPPKHKGHITAGGTFTHGPQYINDKRQEFKGSSLPPAYLHGHISSGGSFSHNPDKRQGFDGHQTGETICTPSGCTTYPKA